MDLRHLTDTQLLKDTFILAKNERETITQILHHLREIDRRKLYSDVRCSSLYDYCTRVLGYADASAHRRIQAARLLGHLPELEEKIEFGILALSNLAQAVTFFKQEDIVVPGEKKEILLQLEHLSTSDCEKKLFEISGKEIPAKDEKKRTSKDKMKVSMVLSDNTIEKLEQIRALIGKKITQEELINKIADIAIERITEKKFGVSTKFSSLEDTSSAT